MWHTDQRKRESGMTTVLLHDFLRIHIPVISKSFIFNNKQSMENTLVLLNNTQNGEFSPSQKWRTTKRGLKCLRCYRSISCSQEIDEKEVVLGQAAAMFFTSVSQPCTNTFWKHLFEETSYQERSEVRNNEENAFCGNLASVWTDQSQLRNWLTCLWFWDTSNSAVIDVVSRAEISLW